MQTLTAFEKWSYAVGNMPFSVKDAAFVNFVVFYYTQVQGLSGSLAGLAMFIAMISDAINDPIVGSWSDTFKSRWGRRHPLILGGGLPMALMFLALFAPPEGMGEIGIFLWLTIVSILLRTFLTIYFIPYSAMGAELSGDYDERTVIAKARVTMAWLAGMTLPAVGFVFIFKGQGDIDGRLIAENYTVYGILSTVIAAAGILFCAWGTRSVISRLPEASSSEAGFSLRKTVSDFRVAMGNRNFRFAVGNALAFGMAAGVYSTLGLYMGTYFWEFSTDQMAGLIIPTALATVLAFMLMGKLGQRFDKTVLLGAASLAIAFNMVWFTGARLLGLLPENGHPIIYPLQLLNALFAVASIVALQTVFISLIADILDEQEHKTGRRQEGVFFAAYSFIQKATTGLGALVAGIVIDVAGIGRATGTADISDASLATLGWFLLVITVVLGVVAYFFAKGIKLTRDEHARLRTELAAQKAGSAG
jgi:GPH family glycoside/pentoside/hexuronide:cation symporter